MVFGFLSKGTMELQLNKFSFTPGEEIEGKVKMQLKKPCKGRSVYANLVAEEKRTQMKMRDGRMSSDTDTVKIIDVKIPLDGEKEYGTQPFEYTFKLKVPNVSNQKAPDGTMGAVMQTLSYMTTGSRVLNWFVEVKLDVPGGFDLGKKQSITVV